MKNKLNYFLALIALLISTVGFSQIDIKVPLKLDSTTIDGKKVYIYPFKVEVKVHSNYWYARKRSKSPSFTYRDYLNAENDDLDEFYGRMDRKEFKEFKKMIMRDARGSKPDFVTRKYIKAVRANPYPLLLQSVDLNNDIIPSLDPLPDGEYIQYYEPFCLIDHKGDCHVDSTHIAAKFNLVNNALEGEGTWFDYNGDVLKQGVFNGGLKEGRWKFQRKEIQFSISDKDSYQYAELGAPMLDTLTRYQEYSRGVENGYFGRYLNSDLPIEEGQYTNGRKSGEWLTRSIRYTGIGLRRKRIRHNDLITERATYNLNDSLTIKQPWIRTDLISIRGNDYGEFNTNSKFSIEATPRFILRPAFPREESLELSEEQTYLHDIDEYGRSLEEFEWRELRARPEAEYHYLQPTVYDPIDRLEKKRGVLIDSLGALPKYTGDYEVYYTNGQLMMRYQFGGDGPVDGDIFWDNGQVHDEIKFIADSNHYQRSIYDYDGKLYESYIYDDLGDFVRVSHEYSNQKYVILEGFKAEDNSYSDYHFYSVYDTLENDLKEPLVLFRSWYREDSSRLHNMSYDPENRQLNGESYSLKGSKPINYDRKFSEDFDSWNGHSSLKFGPFERKATLSASWNDYYEKDSIPRRHVTNAYSYFDVAEEHAFYKNGEKYTGPVRISGNHKKLKIKSEGMDLELPMAGFNNEKMKKAIEKYKAGGKDKYPEIFDLIDASDIEKNIGLYIYSELFGEALEEFFDFGSRDYHNQNALKNMGSKKYRYPVNQYIEGFMKNGKVHGTWKAYDQFGEVASKITFENGEANGDWKRYQYAYPEEDRGFNPYGFVEEPIQLEISAPEEKTRYLIRSTSYKNGLMDGPDVAYNWQGDEIESQVYKEGYRHGPGFERNLLAFTRYNFENGELDGYVQTYLTLKGKDSLLLYDLNYQDGLLQGESKSYHTNGNISKKGFFLNGEPIDDYEAYDSLGFKYHYVKFEYGFPVEEKIWEENELSVRYQFDWQDSILFEPRDITTSQSLEEMLYSLGFGGAYLERPYYGRPSLVPKGGIRYHMTKYFPNDTVSRDGELENGKKIGCWEYFSYDGEKLYEVDYKDSIILVNDSIKFKSKGVYIEMDPAGNVLHESYIIEKSEKYDCSHSDHYEVRQYYTIWQAKDTIDRMNGYVYNFYDNGTLQSEGRMKDGLPTGFWKYYDPFGKLHKYGQYVMGKRNGRWLSGDLSKTKYLGDICLNPNLPDLAEEIKYRENLLNIEIITYQLGKALNHQFYDVDMNRFEESEPDSE